jgi:hypothetical protein
VASPIPEIVKVQLAISTNTDPMILVYNKDRSRECLIPQTKEYCDAFGNELKSFWYAIWNRKKKGYDMFIKPAEWQGW